MSSRDQKEILSLYAGLMEELRSRIRSIELTLSGKTNLASPFVREFCYLQLRIVSEVIALACLVAHGDISSRLKKESSAKEVMRQLESLNPNFFPRTIRHKQVGVNTFEFFDIENVFSKVDLLNLYGRCGDVLHRGNVKKLIKSQSPIQYNFPEINEPKEKILNLLSHHRIDLHEGKLQLICMLNHNSDKRVRVAFLNKQD